MDDLFVTLYLPSSRASFLERFLGPVDLNFEPTNSQKFHQPIFFALDRAEVLLLMAVFFGLLYFVYFKTGYILKLYPFYP